MKIKVLLTSIITLISIAVISGCGGGSDTPQPVSLVTPTPNYGDTGDMAYLTVRVKWPANGKSGSMSTVSENGKELTGSLIPNGTKIIDIYVIDYSETPTPGEVPWEKVVAAGNIHEGEIEKTFPIPVASKVIGKPTPDQGSTGPPPAILVKIFAEAFSEFDEENPGVRNHNKQVAHTDINVEPVSLKAGNHEHRIRLLLNPTVKVEAAESKTERSIVANAAGVSDQWDITANLQLMYGTPFPVSTPMGDSSGEISEPMGGQIINFNIIEGSGTLDATQAETDPNGDCTVHFTATSEYNVIEVSYQYNPDEPDTIVSKTCEVVLGVYSISLTPTNLDIAGNYNAEINTKLSIVCPDPSGTPDPATLPGSVGGKTIKFTVEPNSVNYTGTLPDVTARPEDIVLEPAQLTLGGDGTGKVKVSSELKPIKATIKATLVGTDGQDTSISRTCDVNLTLPEAFIYLCYPDENLVRGYNPNGTLCISIPIEEPYNMVMIDNFIYTSSINAFTITEVNRWGSRGQTTILKEAYGSVSNGLTIHAYNEVLCVGNDAKLATVKVFPLAKNYNFYSDPNCSLIKDLGHNSRWGYFALYLDKTGQSFVARIPFTGGEYQWKKSVRNDTTRIHCERWAGLEYVYLCDDEGIKIYDQITFDSIRALPLPGVLNVGTDARYMYALFASKIKILSPEGNYISEFPVKPGATDMVVRAGGDIPLKQKGYFYLPPTPAPEPYN